MSLARLRTSEPAGGAEDGECAGSSQQAAQHLAAVCPRAEEARHIVETRTIQDKPSQLKKPGRSAHAAIFTGDGNRILSALNSGSFA